MFQLAHYLILIVYALLPLGALAYGIHARVRQGRVWPMASFMFSCMAGSAIAVAFLMLNRWLMDARVGAWEFVRSIYLGVGVMCLLKTIDYWRLRGLFR